MKTPQEVEKVVEEFDEKFPLPKFLALSGGKGVERDAIKNWLRQTLQTLTNQIERAREKYNELIMAVESKYEGESRHETALRYIKEAERGGNEESSLQDTPISNN